VTIERNDTTPSESAVSGYAIVGEEPFEHAAFVDSLRQSFERAGFVRALQPEAAALVLNLIDFDRPRPFRRKSRGTYVAALAVSRDVPVDGLRETYPLLVRALANIALCYVPTANQVLFTTMERGHYAVTGDGDLPSLAAAVVQRLAPLARARLVIDNDFRTDLEPELWGGDEQTEEIAEAGRRLDELGLLPAPFPIEDLLDEHDLRHVYRLYGIGGLSYGNLSARKDEQRFWMSASGVDKSRLVQPGRDILLVSDYEEELGRIVVSIPPGIEPRRVSVDAIEHWMIYQQHPSVQSILHVHAWMDGIPATELNFPCGTEELARSVAALLAAEPDPARAVIGLRNHGITATGASLGEILDRIEPGLLKLVPMT
jgi:ribulose-5-phosphate 4-epimerase/fuculose-1-phosphate aldolase